MHPVWTQGAFGGSGKAGDLDRELPAAMKAWHGAFQNPRVVLTLFQGRGHGLVATRDIEKGEVRLAASTVPG